MISRKAKAMWEGNLIEGTGHISLESGLFNGPYSFKSRFKKKSGTNPEEMLGGAHAGCFSMALSDMLSKDGYKVNKIETEAQVFLDEVEDSFEIVKIILSTKGDIEGIDKEEFEKYANNAKENCPLSKALKSINEIEIKIDLDQH